MLLWLAAAVLALPLLGLAALHLPPVQRMLTRQALAAIRTSADLVVEARRVRVLPARLAVVAEQVRVSAVGHSDEPLLVADSLEVELGWSVVTTRGREIAIERLVATSPRILLRRGADGIWNLPASDGASETQVPGISLQDVRLSGALVEIVDVPSDWHVTLRELSIEPHDGALAAAGEVDARVRDDVMRGTTRATFTLDDGVLDIRQADLRSGASALDVSGRFDTRDSDLDLAAALRLDVADVRGPAGLPDARGTLDARGEITGTLEAPAAVWTIAAAGVTDGRLAPVTLDARGSADTSQVVIETLSASIAGGRAALADATVALTSEASTRLHATIEGVDVGTLLAGYTPGVPLAGRLDGEIDAAGPGLEWTSWRASAQGRMRGTVSSHEGRADVGTGVAVPLDGRMTAALADGRWQADGTVTLQDVANAAANLEGDIDGDAERGGRVDGIIRADVQDLGRAMGAFASAAPEVGGRAALVARVTGTTAEPEVAWTLDATASSPLTAPAHVAAAGSATRHAIAATTVEVTSGPNQLQGTLSAALTGQQLLTGRLNGTLPDLGALVRDAGIEGWRIAGEASLAADLGGTLTQPSVRADVRAADLSAAGQRVDELRARLAWQADDVRLTDIEAHAGPGRLTGGAEVNLARGTHVARLRVDDWPLHPVTDASGAVVAPIAAVLDVDVDTHGPWRRPSGTLALDATSVAVDEKPGPSIAARLTADGQVASGTVAVPEWNTTGEGTLALADGHAFEWSARTDGLTLEPLRPWLPDTLAGIRASLTADVAASGSADAPAETTVARATVHALSASSGDATLALEGPAIIDASRDRVAVGDFVVRTGGLVVSAEGAVGRQSEERPLEVRAQGAIDALQPWLSAFEAEAPAISGQVDLRARFDGTFDAPRPSASLTLSDAAVEVAGAPLRVPSLQLSLEDGLVSAGESQLLWRDAQATLGGRVPLRMLARYVPDAVQPWLGDAQGVARLDAQATRLQPALLEPFIGADVLGSIDGLVSATLVAEATGLAVEQATATLTLDEARFSLQGIPLAQARPTVVQLDAGTLSVKDVLFSGPNTDLAVDGEARLTGDDAGLDVQLRGITALALLQPFVEGMAPGGRAEIDLRASGPLDSPQVQGQVLLTDASLRVAEPRLVVEQIDGTATFDGRQMTITSMRGLANGSPVSVTADLSLSPDNEPRGEARLRVDGMPLEYPEGLRVEADVDLAAAFLPGNRIDVTGDVAVLRGAYRDPIALSALSTALLATEAPTFGGLDGSAGADIRFGIDVETRDDVVVDNNYGRFAVGGNVRLTGSPAAPVLSGRLTLEEGGELYIGGLTYRVERGAIDFANAARIEPIVDLAAETRASGERIRIEASGSVEQLEVTLSAPDASQPLSQAELASLLVSGRGLDDLSGTAAGEQLLTLISADLFGVIGRGVGLDALRLERDLMLDDRASAGEVDVAAETDPVARLTLVKRLHSDVEVLFSQNLRDASAITWLVTWRPLRRVEARLLQRDDRSMSYEFRHEIVFGATPSRSGSRETKPEVTGVTLTVDDPTLHDGLTGVLRLDEGDAFDFYRWQEDRDRLARWLHARRYYEHRVVARRETADGQDGPVVSLSYDVQTGPRGELEVHGATLGEDVRARMREAWQGSVFDGFLAADLARIAREAMFARGFPLTAVDVTTALEDDGRSKRVSVHIDPGPPLDAAVEVAGVAPALDEAFTQWLDAGGRLLAWLDPEALASRARTWLRNRGALAAEVSLSDPVAEGGRAVRAIRVVDGGLYTLRRLMVEGVPSARETLARQELGLSPGEPFDATRLGMAVRDLEHWYLSEGFRAVDVAASSAVHHEEQAVDVTVNVEEGARAIIVATHIDGRERTREAILERAIAMPLGSVATPSGLLAARKRLYDTGVVASADVRIDEAGAVEVEPDGTRVQPVAVTGVVHEMPRLRLRYGLAVNDDVLQADVLRATETRRVTPGLSALLENRNLFGRAITSGVSARYERARQTGRTFLTTPAILGYDAWLQLSAGIARSRLAPDATDSPIDIRTDVSTGVTQALPWLEGLRLTYGYRYERSRTYDPQNPDLFDITITAPRLSSTAFIDRRDDAGAPTRGWFHASTLELSRGWLGSDFEFAKYYVQQSAYRSIGNVVLAGRAQLGLGRGFGGQDLIGSERFSAGGATSVRGYGESAIGEIDPILGIARGDGLVVLNGEVRLPIWRWISGVGFVDAGGVYPRVGDIGWDGLLWATGAGVRVSTPAGLVRVDVGVPIRRRPADKSWRVYVGLGQVF